MTDTRARELAHEIIHCHPAIGADGDPIHYEKCYRVTARIQSALRAAGNDALERAAKVADIWAQTEPNLGKSDNEFAVRALAGAMAESGRRIAEGVRALKSTETT